MKKDSSKNEQTVVSKADKKQIILGIVILLVAILTLTYAFLGADNQSTDQKQALVATPDAEKAAATEEVVPEKPKHIFLTFTATAEKDTEYTVAYILDENEIFGMDENKSVSQVIKAGTADYEIEIPVEQFYSFRLNMGWNSGKMKVSNLQLKGTREEDVSSPMYYELMGKIDLDENNTFLVDEERLASLIYHPELKANYEERMAERLKEASKDEAANENAEEQVETETTATTEETAEEKAAEETVTETETKAEDENKAETEETAEGKATEAE